MSSRRGTPLPQFRFSTPSSPLASSPIAIRSSPTRSSIGQSRPRLTALQDVLDQLTQSPSPTRDETPAASSSFAAHIDRLVEDLNEVAPSVLTPFARPPTITIASNVKDRPFDPDGPIDTEVSLILGSMFRLGGIAGLAHALRVVARFYQTSPSIAGLPGFRGANYNDVSDPNNEVDVMNMLCTQNIDFIRHIIRGDLMYQYRTHPGLAMAFDIDHGMKKAPGCYVQALVRQRNELVPPSTQSTQPSQSVGRQKNPHRGRWLTGREIHRVYHTVKDYLHGPNKSDTSIEMAMAIDDLFQPPPDQKNKSDYKAGYRRYVLPPRSVQQKGNQNRVEEWLDSWKLRFIDRIQPLLEDERVNKSTNPLLDIPFRSNIFEIGYGVDVLARATAHNSHSSSNNLYLLYLAVVHYLFDRNFQIFEVHRFQTNHISHFGAGAYHHAIISDVGQTVMAGAEWFQGGLNPQPAGGAGVKDSVLQRRGKWLEDNFNSIYTRGSSYRTNLRKCTETLDKLEDDVDRYVDRFRIVQDVQKERDDLKVQVAAIEEKIHTLRQVQMLMETKKVFDAYRAADYLRPMSIEPSPSVSDNGEPATIQEDVREEDSEDGDEVVESVEMYD